MLPWIFSNEAVKLCPLLNSKMALCPSHSGECRWFSKGLLKSLRSGKVVLALVTVLEITLDLPFWAVGNKEKQWNLSARAICYNLENLAFPSVSATYDAIKAVVVKVILITLNMKILNFFF